MSSGKVKPTATSTQTNELPAYARPYFENIMSRAQTASNQSYQPYGEQRIADFTGDTNQAFDITRNLAAQGTPGVNAGMGVTQQAANAGFNAGNYQSNAIQQQAFGQQQADQYMSPYMNSVIQRQKDAALRDYSEGQPARDTQAINAGAFGGYRDAIQQGVAQRGLGNRLNDIEASGRQQAFTNAQQQYNADRQASIGAQTTTENQRLAAAQYGLAGANLGLQSGAQMGALNAQQQGLTLAQVQALNNQGVAQQELKQRELDLGYQNFVDQRDFEKNQIGYLSNIMRGVPVQANTTTTQATRQPSPIAQYGGLAMSALAMLSSGGVINGARK
jgi:hypothetical protein